MALTGTVKLFNPSKGFGFITDAQGQDVFLHVKACIDGGVPQKGDAVGGRNSAWEIYQQYFQHTKKYKFKKPQK